MSELSLLSGVNRTSRLRPPTSEFDPNRKSDLKSKLTNEREIAANVLVRPDDDDRQKALEH